MGCCIQSAKSKAKESIGKMFEESVVDPSQLSELCLSLSSSDTAVLRKKYASQLADNPALAAALLTKSVDYMKPQVSSFEDAVKNGNLASHLALGDGSQTMNCWQFCMAADLLAGTTDEATLKNWVEGDDVPSQKKWFARGGSWGSWTLFTKQSGIPASGQLILRVRVSKSDGTPASNEPDHVVISCGDGFVMTHDGPQGMEKERACKQTLAAMHDRVDSLNDNLEKADQSKIEAAKSVDMDLSEIQDQLSKVTNALYTGPAPWC